MSYGHQVPERLGKAMDAASDEMDKIMEKISFLRDEIMKIDCSCEICVGEITPISLLIPKRDAFPHPSRKRRLRWWNRLRVFFGHDFWPSSMRHKR